VKRYYLPYRNKAECLIHQAVANEKRVGHISSHSFTPELDGKRRDADIGLLYDPARPGEVELCIQWQAYLKAHAPQWNVRRNYPYLGKADGLTSYFRQCFPPAAYVGIEL
jgi:predicted N-formylglutamate amidohydrolase